ncbi:hypothetical protein PVK06_011058 [Gossypium arboreum]|uniref:RRM domain-containing protein n=1 Tax=Gossypium arboreum TaxID=29729 RepID=A0ABR0Q8A7_GOSAR|nr:hypothetical protein PVK06_011058 [Gossypium arboreum]
MEEAKSRSCTTLFINNIPSRVSWKDIRFQDLVDARRAVRRLNGFRYYGCTIDVNLARLTAAFHTGKSPT